MRAMNRPSLAGRWNSAVWNAIGPVPARRRGGDAQLGEHVPVLDHLAQRLDRLDLVLARTALRYHERCASLPLSSTSVPVAVHVVAHRGGNAVVQRRRAPRRRRWHAGRRGSARTDRETCRRARSGSASITSTSSGAPSRSRGTRSQTSSPVMPWSAPDGNSAERVPVVELVGCPSARRARWRPGTGTTRRGSR